MTLYGSYCVPQRMHWSPNPQYLRRWPCLEIGSLKKQVKMKSLGWTPIQYISFKKGTPGAHNIGTQGRKWYWRQPLGWCIHKPRSTKGCRQVSGSLEIRSRFSFPVLRRSLTSGLWNCEAIHFCYLSLPVLSTCLWQPLETNTLSSVNKILGNLETLSSLPYS